MALPKDLVSKTVTSRDGTLIYAEALGDRTKPHLVFLHGLTSNCTVFDGLFTHPSLVNDFYMVRYDSRGHGRSGKPDQPEAYTSEKYADDWKTVADAFELDKPIQVGWSLGAALSADILSNLPAKTLAGIINICGIPYHGEIMSNAGTPLLGQWAGGFTSNDDATAALNVRASIGPNLIYRWDALPFQTQMQFLGSATLLLPVVAQCIFGRTSDPTALYKAGKQNDSDAPLPLLFIHGKNDEVIQTKVLAAELKKEFEDYDELFLDECKHAPFLDQREAFVIKLVEFVGRVHNS